MASLGGEIANKAMWVYPKNLGFIPPERWGHSACHSHGLVYIYGGCLHLSDVIVLNLNTMSFSALATKGKGPGTRDSHSAVLWQNKMLIFGGTDGFRKLNDLHVLDLGSNEWTHPISTGNPPSPRESHTATLVGEDKLLVFGGSGEGIGNYLNDLHVLDLKSMAWSSTDGLVKGDAPSPRDSHAASAVGDELFVFGGDSGDRYHGDVHRFDTKTMTWIKLVVYGSAPGARAGHAAVTIGHKVYVIGGVGDTTHCNDAWILDTEKCSWSKLDVYGLAPQGRFSHTAVVVGYDIVIYGGCGEDERPLREFLILQLRNQKPIEWHNISPSVGLGTHLPMQENRRSDQRYINGFKTIMRLGSVIEAKTTTIETLELHSKRRRSTKTSDTVQSEPEEHSLSVSQHSSQSQSDHEQTTVRTPPKPFPLRAFPFFNLPTAEERSIQERTHPTYPSMIGAEVQGKVDGAFDSGYLMTALINGRVFRGVLFAPVSEVVQRRGGAFQESVTPMKIGAGGSEMGFGPGSDSGGRGSMAQPSSSYREIALVKREALRRRRELQGVVLSLGVPGNGH